MRWLLQLLLVAALAVGGYASFQKYSQWRSSKATDSSITLVNVDRGAIAVSVVESGTLESSDNATVKCKVEAILGTVSSDTVAMAARATTGGGMAGGSMAGGGGSAGGMGGGLVCIANWKI